MLAEDDGDGRAGATPAGAARWQAVGLRVGLFVLAAALPLLRQRGNPSWDSLWAEDGFMLYQDVLDAGPVEPLFRAYTGYLVLAPRLLAAPLRWVPIELVAAYVAVVATTATALLAAFTHRCTKGWIASAPVRLVVTALVVLLPAAALENTATLVNVIWALVAVTPWAILSHRQGRADVAARCAVVFLAATSTPVALLFVPLALAWAWRERTRAVLAVLVAYGVGAVVQVATMLFTETEILPEPPQRPLDEVVDLLGVRLFGVALVGPQQAPRLWDDHGTVVGLVAALVVGVLFALALRGADRRSQVLASGFAGAAVVMFLGLVLSRGTLPFRFGVPFDMRSHMRYSVPPTFLLASAFAVLVGNREGDGPGAVVPRRAFVLHAVVLMALCFPTVGYRGLGPGWRQHLREARASCDAGAAGLAPPPVGQPSDGDEAIVEQDDRPFWGIRVDCDDLPR